MSKAWQELLGLCSQRIHEGPSSHYIKGGYPSGEMKEASMYTDCPFKTFVLESLIWILISSVRF